MASVIRFLLIITNKNTTNAIYKLGLRSAKSFVSVKNNYIEGVCSIKGGSKTNSVFRAFIY